MQGYQGVNGSLWTGLTDSGFAANAVFSLVSS